MSKVYNINIVDQKSGDLIADANGPLDVISYVARGARGTMAQAEDGTDFAVSVTELEKLGGAAVRSVASVTGDAEVATYVLLKRLRSERTTDEPETTEPTPATEDETAEPVPAEDENTENTPRRRGRGATATAE